MNQQTFKILYDSRSISFLLCLILGSTVFVTAQRRNPLLTPTSFDDVVFAIAFSPDGRTLAIARGAAAPMTRFGRIELWETENGKLRHVIKGFDGPVMSMLFSPDGHTIVTGSLEYRSNKIQDVKRYGGMTKGELKWWDSQTGELKYHITLPGEVNANLKLALSPNGKDLVVAETFMTYSYAAYSPSVQPPVLGVSSPFPTAPFGPLVFYSSDMKLVDATTGEVKLKLNDDQANTILYSPDGSTLVLAQRGEVRLCNAQTGKEERKLKGFKGRTNAISFSPDGRLLAVASTSYERESYGNLVKIIGISQVKLFDTRTWREMRKISDIGAVSTLAFSPNSKQLLMGGVMRQGEKEVPGINILNLESSELATIPTGEDFTESVDGLTVSKDGRFMAFRSGPTAVKLMDRTLSLKQTWDAHSAGDEVERPVSRFLVSAKRVLAVAFAGDGRTLTAETDQGEIKTWDPRTGEVKGQLKSEQNDPAVVTVSDDGKSFAELVEGKVLIWNSSSPSKQVISLPDNRAATAMTLSPDGHRLAIGLNDEILLLDGAGKLSKTLKSARGLVKDLVFSPDGHTLALVTEKGAIEIWNVATERIEQVLAIGMEVTALRFAPNNQTLAVATTDRDITLWNAQAGQAIMKLDKHDAAVNAIAFSADGELMASGSDDRTVVIWQVSSGKSKRTLKGHDQTVTALAFSPDDKLLASGSGNASVVIWEVRSGKFTRVLR
jgi:WD40 repeat protein